MNTSRFSSFFALLLGGALAAPSFAQSSATPGTISNVTLNFTITETIGGFLIKNADLEKGFGKNPSVSYDEDMILNPLGFNPESAGANHYMVKNTVRYRIFDKDMEEFVDPTSDEVTYSTKQLVTRYGNAQFLTDLVNAEILPAPSTATTAAQKIAGWSLVAVRVASGEDSEDEDDNSYVFAIKTGQTPVLVGKIGDWAESDENSDTLRLFVYPGADAETYNATETEATKYTRTSDGEGGFFFEPGEPTFTYRETYSGTSAVSVQLRRPTEVSIYGSGLARYSGSYNAKLDMTLIGAINASIAGNFYQGAGSSEDSTGTGKAGVVSGTFALTAERALADVSQYAALIPSTSPVAE